MFVQPSNPPRRSRDRSIGSFTFGEVSTEGGSSFVRFASFYGTFLFFFFGFYIHSHPPQDRSANILRGAEEERKRGEQGRKTSISSSRPLLPLTVIFPGLSTTNLPSTASSLFHSSLSTTPSLYITSEDSLERLPSSTSSFLRSFPPHLLPSSLLPSLPLAMSIAGLIFLSSAG